MINESSGMPRLDRRQLRSQGRTVKTAKLPGITRQGATGRSAQTDPSKWLVLLLVSSINQPPKWYPQKAQTQNVYAVCDIAQLNGRHEAHDSRRSVLSGRSRAGGCCDKGLYTALGVAC